MSRFGCTITVAGGKAPSSQSSFPWVAVTANFPSAAIDGGSTSINNLGGNLKCYTDSSKGTRLPIEVVKFTTGGSPSVLIWGKSPTLNVASTVYIEADTIATSQPANNATFGRNAVWSAFDWKYHLDESSGTAATDSAGNTDGTYESPLPSLNANGGQNFVAGNNGRIEAANSSTLTRSSFTYSARILPDNTNSNKSIIACDSSTSGTRFWQWRVTSAEKSSLILWDGSGNIFVNEVGSTGVGTTDISNVDFVFDGSNYKCYINGSVVVNVASTTQIDARVTRSVYIGARKQTDAQSDKFDGEIFEASQQSGTYKTTDWIVTEYNNQSDPSSFWTTSSWEDQDDVESISPASIASSEAFGTPVITAGVVNIVPSSIDSSEAFGTATVSSGATVITPTSIATQENVPTPTISSGSVSISPTGITSQEAVASPVVGSLGVSLSPPSIESLEAFGVVIVERLLATLAPLGIASVEEFGRPTVIGGDTLVIPVSERQTWNRIAKHLRTVGFKGSDNDVIVGWLISEGLLEGSYNDMWNEYLFRNGFFALTLADKYAAWRQN